MKKTIIILTLWFAGITMVQAEPQKFISSDSRVNVLELYTSEGCSSCPPADKWLSKYKQDKRLWKELIPVAFHVDYWNYIGWPDRFASAEFGDRQRRYAQSKNFSTVYTPGMLLNGEEWRSWFYKRPLSLDKSTDAGTLSVELNGDQFLANYQSKKQSDRTYLNVAILGFDIKTTVKAGENSGRELHHDFVVLGYKRIPMQQKDGKLFISSSLPKQIENVTRKGLAVWVDHGRDLTPVQATGGWLVSN